MESVQSNTTTNTFTDRFGIDRDCTWLSKRIPQHQTFYCHTFGADAACPEICNRMELCTTPDDASRVIDANSTPPKTCAWLRFSMSIDYYFAKTAYCDGPNPEARDACPHTCGRCGTYDPDELVTDTPTPSPALVIPTVSPTASTIDTMTQPPVHIVTLSPANSCSVCGEGKHVTAPIHSTVMAPDGSGSMECEFLELGGFMGAFPNCDDFPALISEACECAPIGAPTTSSVVTVPPVTGEPASSSDDDEDLLAPVSPVAPIAPVSPVAPTTPRPTVPPTLDPTPKPTPDPTPLPTPNPTPDPTPLPTPNPTPDPTPVPPAPSQEPTRTITDTGEFPNLPPYVVLLYPTVDPSPRPTRSPSSSPSSSSPTTLAPTKAPTPEPSASPTTAEPTLPLVTVTTTGVRMDLEDTSYLNRAAVDAWQILTAATIQESFATDDTQVTVLLTDQTLDTPIVIARMGDLNTWNRRLDDDRKRLHLVFTVTVRIRTEKEIRQPDVHRSIANAFSDLADQQEYVLDLRESGIAAFKKTLTVGVTVNNDDVDRTTDGVNNQIPAPNNNTSSNDVNVGLLAGLVGVAVGVLGLASLGLLQYSRRRRRQVVVNDDEERADAQQQQGIPTIQKKGSLRIMNNTFGGELMKDDDISTIGDPLPPGMAAGGIQDDPTTAGSVSLPWDMQQQVRGGYNNNSATNSIATSTGTRSFQSRRPLYVEEDDQRSLENQYHHHVAQFDVVAPSSGSLGLVLEPSRDGTYYVVHMVKSQSPLFDSGVSVGDCLLRVNGHDASLAYNNNDLNTLLQQSNQSNTTTRTLTFGRGVIEAEEDDSFQEEDQVAAQEQQPSSFWQPWSNNATTPKRTNNHSNTNNLLDQFWRPPNKEEADADAEEIDFDDALMNFDNLSI